MVDSTNNQPDSNVAPKELALDIKDREQFNALQFVQTDANPGDLTVILPDSTPDNPDDNEQIVFPDYIALGSAGIPPALTLADGTVIPGEDILDLIEGLDYGKVAPAAGQQGGPNSDGSGAGFDRYTTEGLGDDLNHGPYAGGYLGPRVEFGDAEPGYEDEDGSGGGGFVSPSVVYQNNQATFPAMMNLPNHAVPNPFDPNSLPPQDMGGGIHQFWFEANLGPTGSVGQRDDWDGGRVWLDDGETITLTNQTPGGHYWLAIDVNLPQGAVSLQPEGQPQVSSFLWDNVLETDSVGQSLSYTVPVGGGGWVYFGAGAVVGVTDNVGQGMSDTAYHDYSTLVTITDAGLGPYNGPPVTSNMLGGTTGDDIIVSGPGNDTLTGDSGADTFQYNSINDGHDTIMDFSIGDGDVINLDALFDSLDLPDLSPLRNDVLVHDDPNGNAVLTIGDGTFTDTEHAGAAAADFEITLSGAVGITDLDIANWILNGNIVVD